MKEKDTTIRLKEETRNRLNVLRGGDSDDKFITMILDRFEPDIIKMKDAEREKLLKLEKEKRAKRLQRESEKTKEILDNKAAENDERFNRSQIERGGSYTEKLTEDEAAEYAKENGIDLNRWAYDSHIGKFISKEIWEKTQR